CGGEGTAAEALYSPAVPIFRTMLRIVEQYRAPRAVRQGLLRSRRGRRPHAKRTSAGRPTQTGPIAAQALAQPATCRRPHEVREVRVFHSRSGGTRDAGER